MATISSRLNAPPDSRRRGANPDFERIIKRIFTTKQVRAKQQFHINLLKES
jgi:hypothetical protein